MTIRTLLLIVALGVTGIVNAADPPPGPGHPADPGPNSVPLTRDMLDAIMPKIPTKNGHPDPELLCIASDLYSNKAELAPLRGLIPLTQLELAAPSQAMLSLLRMPTARERAAIRVYGEMLTGCLQTQRDVTKATDSASLTDNLDAYDVLMANAALEDLYEGISSYAAYTARVSLLRKSFHSE